MTIKNSLISAAASALLIAAITGCSSNSTSSSSSSTSTSGGIQSAVTAVDGYIYNGKVEAFYLTDDNATMGAVTLSAADTTRDTAANTWTVGGVKYSLADTNTSIKDKIKFFRLSGVGSTSAGTTFTPATYIETGASGAGYDTNDTILGTTFVMYAPANGAILSPLTNLIYQANSAALGTVAVGSSTATVGTITTDINSSYLTSLEANATAIAANLGLGDVNILTADPVALEATNPTLRLVNALLKGAPAATANSIIGATAPTSATLTNTLATLKTAFTAGSMTSTLLDDLIVRTNAGTFTTADVATMNVEKSVENNALTNKAAATLTGKYPVNSISVNTVESDELIASGAKITSNAISVDINMTNVATDANISNNGFKLLVTVQGDKAFVGTSDNNSSTGLVLEIPFDLNSTDGTIGYTVTPGALCPFEVRASDGSAVVAVADTNASTMLIDTSMSIQTSKTLRIDVGTILGTLTGFADANLTASGTSVLATDIMDNISKVQIILVDSNSKMIKVDRAGVNQFNFPSATLAGFTGSPSGTGISIVDLGDIDFREAYTATNAAPDQNLSFAVEGSTGGSTSSADTNSTARAIVNNNTGYNAILNVSISDAAERNTTAAFTFGSMLTDTNSSYLSDRIKKASNAVVTGTNVFEVNTTSTTVGELNTTITTLMTDEFGETNTTVTYITVNRAPQTGAGAFTDASFLDGNISIAVLKDLDGNDVNATVQVWDINKSINTWRTIPNLSTGNLVEINDTLGRYNFVLSDDNLTVEMNGTITSTADLNITFRIINANDTAPVTHAAMLGMNDTNLTVTH